MRPRHTRRRGAKRAPAPLVPRAVLLHPSIQARAPCGQEQRVQREQLGAPRLRVAQRVDAQLAPLGVVDQRSGPPDAAAPDLGGVSQAFGRDVRLRLEARDVLAQRIHRPLRRRILRADEPAAGSACCHILRDCDRPEQRGGRLLLRAVLRLGGLVERGRADVSERGTDLVLAEDGPARLLRVQVRKHHLHLVDAAIRPPAHLVRACIGGRHQRAALVLARVLLRALFVLLPLLVSKASVLGVVADVKAVHDSTLAGELASVGGEREHALAPRAQRGGLGKVCCGHHRVLSYT